MKQTAIFISSIVLVAVVIYFGYYFPVWLTASLIAGVVLIAALINHAPKYLKRKKKAQPERASPKTILIGGYKVRKSYFVMGIIFLLLILFNPSMKDFKEYKGYHNDDGLQRDSYFMIFSIYRSGNSRYIGFFKNFIYVGSK